MYDYYMLKFKKKKRQRYITYERGVFRMGLWLIEEQARLPTVFIFFSETYRLNLKLTELI